LIRNGSIFQVYRVGPDTAVMFNDKAIMVVILNGY